MNDFTYYYNSSSQKKVNAKNSFDRFGDDLTELILQYLTFEDKVRLECVSKQWRRLVFNKQFVIDLRPETVTKDSLRRLYSLSEPSLDRQALESVLKKCPNIMEVIIVLYHFNNFKVDSFVLSLIGRYCKHIKSLKFRDIRSDDKTLDFFRMYGHKLEELELPKNFCDDYEEFKQILKFCPNLERIHFYPLKYYFDHDKEFLPKLQHIKSLVEITPQDLYELKIMSDKYSQSMKSLNIDLKGLNREELKIFIQCISRFKNLRQFKLIIDSLEIEEPIDDCLLLIGQKCNKLLKLDLKINENIHITDHFFDSFSKFKAIEKLKITLSEYIEVNGSIECFKHCKQLKELDITYDGLREDFFANIASFVPKLQSLHISTYEIFSNSFVNSFQSMKSIQKVTLHRKHHFIWYFGKCLSEVMLSPNRMKVFSIDENCGFIKKTWDPFGI